MSDGIRTLSAEAYFKADGISRSMLDDMLISPLLFWAKHVGKTMAEEETPAMRLGSLTHRFILEPETTADAFHVKPEDMSFATKEGKAWKAEHCDRPILSFDEAAAIRAMREAVWRNKTARSYIEGAHTERCLFAQDGKGTLRKARLDLIPRRGNTLADLKTCLSAGEHDMEKAMDKLGYNRQAAFTLALCRMLGMEWTNWDLICVENTPPYDVVVWPVDERAIRVGHAEVEKAIQDYRNCLESGIWPGKEAALPDIRNRILTLPKWRERELNAA